jgi:glutaredoxin 3
MRGRCEEHHLALGPDGRCVLCKRRDRPVSTPPAPAPSHAPGVVVISPWLILGGIAVMATVAAAALGLLPIAPQTISALPAPEPVAVPEGVLPQAQVPAAEALPGLALPPSPVPAPIPIGSSAPPEEMAEPSPNEGAEEAGRADAEQARMEELLRTARKRVSITMYSTTWCPHCDRARQYLRTHDISATEHDIDQSTTAAERLARVNPRKSVPTFEVDDEVVIGFSARGLEGAIERAAQTRLRRWGH